MLLNLDSPDGSGRSWVDWWLDWVPGRDCWASGHWDPVKMINIFKHIYFFNFQKSMTHLFGRRMDRDPRCIGSMDALAIGWMVAYWNFFMDSIEKKWLMIKNDLRLKMTLNKHFPEMKSTPWTRRSIHLQKAAGCRRRPLGMKLGYREELHPDNQLVVGFPGGNGRWTFF